MLSLLNIPLVNLLPGVFVSMFLINLHQIFCKQRIDEVTPDLDLVVHVIEHIDRHGEPGNYLTHNLKQQSHTVGFLASVICLLLYFISFL